MRIDLSLRSIDARISDLVDAARAAEAAGLDGVWVYDHLSGHSFGGSRAVDVWVALTAIAESTERIAIGPLVLNTAARHPAHIAVAAATLQERSGGRLRLGLGAGAGHGDPYAAELTMLGLPVLGAAERRQRVEETVGYLRALWSGGGDFLGRHHRLDDPTDVLLADPPPDLIVAANGPKMARLGGDIGDGLNVHDFQDDLVALAQLGRDRAAAREASDFELSIEGPDVTIWLDSDDPMRQRVLEASPDRVMLRWSPPDGIETITRLAQLD
ncbi:MAG: LLM class flavin-dependent oxidoreductase [Actinomycetota bacterium]